MTGIERLNHPSAINTLRDQIAPEATDQELQYFGQVCQRVDLSPLKGEIYLIGRYDSRLKRAVHRPQISVDGRRVLASRTGLLRGIEGPMWCGPRNPETGQLEWLDVWDDTDYPYAARVLVYVDGWIKPANGTCKWSEFAQVKSDGQLTAMWKQYPSHMLGKTAESLALRRAFADVIPGNIAEDYADPVEPHVGIVHGNPVDLQTGEISPPAAGPENGEHPPSGRAIASLPPHQPDKTVGAIASGNAAAASGQTAQSVENPVRAVSNSPTKPDPKPASRPQGKHEWFDEHGKPF